MPRHSSFLPLALLLALAGAARAGEVLVAVASNFVRPLESVAEGFAASSGHTLTISSGATGKFYAQIVAGAPFEVLLAADGDTPRKLIAAGRAVEGSTFTYASGRLVLWSATPGLVDAEGAVLGSDRFAHLAIANPKVAPYGVAAMQVLQARGLVRKLAPKWVTGESLAQAYQFVATGNAELGFVARSQVMGAGGSQWLVPAALHDPIRQDAVLLEPGRRNPAAAALLAYLKGEPARQVVESFGYGR